VKSFFCRTQEEARMMMQESELLSTRGPQRPQLEPALQHGSKGKNVAPVERVISVLAGAALLGYGLGRGRLTGLALALAGGGLLHRGVTGHCRTYAALGWTEVKGGSGVAFELSTTILRPRDEVYRAWRDFESHPRFIPRLLAVRGLEDGRTRWVYQGPGGSTVEWTSRLVEERPGERLAWLTLPGSRLPQSGTVSFEEAPGQRGTVVHLSLRYLAPGGWLGLRVSRLLGLEPKQQLSEGLRRFKQLVEAGEVATVETQPSGRRSPLGRALSPRA
jgi:uncharacterized membrane protein